MTQPAAPKRRGKKSKVKTVVAKWPAGQSYAWTKIVSILKSLVQNSVIEFSENGIRILAVTDDRTALVQLKVPKNKYYKFIPVPHPETGELMTTREVSVDYAPLYNTLQKLTSEESLEFYLNDNDDSKLFGRMKNRDKRVYRDFEIAAMNLLDDTPVSIPDDLLVDGIISISAADLKTIFCQSRGAGDVEICVTYDPTQEWYSVVYEDEDEADMITDGNGNGMGAGGCSDDDSQAAAPKGAKAKRKKKKVGKKGGGGNGGDGSAALLAAAGGPVPSQSRGGASAASSSGAAEEAYVSVAGLVDTQGAENGQQGERQSQEPQQSTQDVLKNAEVSEKNLRPVTNCIGDMRKEVDEDMERMGGPGMSKQRQRKQRQKRDQAMQVANSIQKGGKLPPGMRVEKMVGAHKIFFHVRSELVLVTECVTEQGGTIRVGRRRGAPPVFCQAYQLLKLQAAADAASLVTTAELMFGGFSETHKSDQEGNLLYWVSDPQEEPEDVEIQMTTEATDWPVIEETPPLPLIMQFRTELGYLWIMVGNKTPKDGYGNEMEVTAENEAKRLAACALRYNSVYSDSEEESDSENGVDWSDSDDGEGAGDGEGRGDEEGEPMDTDSGMSDAERAEVHKRRRLAAK